MGRRSSPGASATCWWTRWLVPSSSPRKASLLSLPQRQIAADRRLDQVVLDPGAVVSDSERGHVAAAVPLLITYMAVGGSGTGTPERLRGGPSPRDLISAYPPLRLF